MVGQLYAPDDRRRDAGFSLYYLGINLGALLAPLVTGWLAQGTRFQTQLRDWGVDPATSWHRGFALAAAGVLWSAYHGLLTAAAIAAGVGYLLLLVTLGFFIWLFRAGTWSAAERKQLIAITVLGGAAAGGGARGEQ